MRLPGRKPVEAAQVIRIEPPSGIPPLNLPQIWRYRPIAYCLARRDLKLRYRQTLAGVTWVAAQPLASALIFTIFFKQWLKVSSGGAPYVVFVFCGIVPWSYFVQVLAGCATSVVSQRSLVTKVWLPRVMLPVSPALGALVDLGISLLFLIGMLFYYRVGLHVSMLAAPVFVAMAVFTAVGAGFWLAALDVWYRDVAQVLPFFVQLWFFATPVAYSSEVVPAAWRWVYRLNPMAGVIDGLRWSILGTQTLTASALATSSAATLLLLIGGLYFYRAREGEFADVI
jgi:lipopolysaccharide transport system permease protein